MSNDENKDLIVSNLFEEIEVNLSYVGCTAIEDKLQDVISI